MNDPSIAESAPTPLQELLAEHFSRPALSALLGAGSGGLPRDLWSAGLESPVALFLARPGKSFRAELVALSFELAGGLGPCPPRLSAIVELLHAGSLIIDDIEDGSASRRGAPTLHLSHGLPIALNAGNWMYFWALGLIEQVATSSELELSMHRWVHRTLLRCHHGQALDLTSNVYQLPQRELAGVVLASAELKTGALMELSAALGALAAGAPPALVSELAQFGCSMGVALQMLDDVGGIVSERRCHKGHEDLVLARPTWPWAWLSAELPPAAFEDLRRLGREVERREQHPELLASRVREQLHGSGRLRIRRQVQQSCARLEAVCGRQPALKAVRSQLRRMEQSYG
jgi:geranylgeranyl pyrophosphate synthase